MRKVYLTAILFSLPILVSAAGLIPCGGEGEETCQFCHTVLLVENVAGWLVKIFGIILVIVIIVAGLRLVTSVGEASAKTQAKKWIAQFVIGYVIILAAWLVIDFGLRVLVNVTVYNKWNDISTLECPVQTEVTTKT